MVRAGAGSGSRPASLVARLVLHRWWGTFSGSSSCPAATRPEPGSSACTSNARRFAARSCASVESRCPRLPHACERKEQVPIASPQPTHLARIHSAQQVEPIGRAIVGAIVRRWHGQASPRGVGLCQPFARLHRSSNCSACCAQMREKRRQQAAGVGFEPTERLAALSGFQDETAVLSDNGNVQQLCKVEFSRAIRNAIVWPGFASFARLLARSN
jgi:hypothetical protein